MSRSLLRRLRSSISLSLGLACILWTVGAPAYAASEAPQAEALTPGDFATGRTIELSSSGAIQRVSLDLDVYQGSVEPRLADLRVFDAAGIAVPHALHSPPRPEPREGHAIEVPFFPLPRAPASGSSVPLERGGGAYAIDAELSETGAILRMRPAWSPETGGAASAPTGILIDASQLDHPVVAVELILAASEEDFIVPLKLHGSDDLARFHDLGAHAVIARLTRGAHRIEQSRIELSPTRSDYLRIRWPRPGPALDVRAVRLQLASEATPTALRRDRIAGRPIADEPHAFLFDLGGTPPVRRAQIDLLEDNSLVEARLYSSSGAEGPWTRHFDGLLYRLGDAGVVRNPEIRCGEKRRRFFKLVVSPKGGGAGQQVPVLEIAWVPEQVLFVTRGAAPYQLAYGRAGAPKVVFDAGRLLSIDAAQTPSRAAEAARLGGERSLAGSRVLTAPTPPLPTRTVVLWAVLALSALVVVAMSVRLLREMG